MNKQFFSFLIIISIFSNFSLIAEESKINKLKKSISNLKNPAKIESAVGLAGMAHLMCTTISLLAHDYAHEKTDAFINGESYTIADMVSGPIGGIASIYSLMVAFQILEAKLNKQTWKKGFAQGLKKPFTINAEISDKVAETFSNNKKTETSFKDTFFLTLASLNSGILLREFITGFTPISARCGYASDDDGAWLWEKLGFKEDLSIKKRTALSMQLAPLLLATGSGLIKGINNK